MKTEVLHQLSEGKDNAISGKILAQRLGQKDSRHARLAIIDLIVEDGIPIIGDSGHGYYIATTRAECDKALKVLRDSYGVMLYRHYKYLKRAREKKFSGQLSMM